MRSRGTLLATVLWTALTAASAAAVDVHDTRLLAQPAVSATHVAFGYASDVWVTGLTGGAARRLTSQGGEESRPRFSPDGRLLAFSAEYEGNVDVYVVPVEGGVPTRLTWHPGEDLVQGFTPDGTRVLFTSPRNVHTRRHVQLFTVPVAGGLVERLPVPHAAKATFAPDGARLAYFSDAAGEYELHVAPQDGKGEVKRYALGGAGFYERPRWSPDSAKLSFIDNSRSLY